jgi:MFS transporter, PHS family, inorganic phosphate transporter
LIALGYGLALNQSTVLTLINYNGPPKNSLGYTVPSNVWNTFYQKAIGNIIIACAGTVPGYWFTVGFVEILGRKPIQYMGFAVINIILFILAAMWTTISTQQVTFMVLFTISQFFFQFGPNTTTFIVPGEVFPTRWRSTGHGIAAASGKLGAIIGVQFIGPIFASNVKTVLWSFGAVMFTGLLATALVPETKGKTLEELSGENEVDGFLITTKE